MTNTTKQALSEWTVDQLSTELERIHTQMAAIKTAAVNDEASAWVWEDMHDWTIAISNELTRRAAVEAETA